MKYTVKNFRVFNQEGFEFDLSKPITFLTGCNSSGKSSLVKSLLVLNNYIDGLRKDYNKTNDFDLVKHTLGLGKTAFQLGDFKSVINRNENDGLLHFSYTIKPNQAIIPFTIEYIFGENEDDLMNDASLKHLKITTSDEILLQISVVDKKIRLEHANLFPLKESYLKYAFYSMAEKLASASQIYSVMGDKSGYTEEELERMSADLEKLMKISLTKLDKNDIKSFQNYYANNPDLNFNDWVSLKNSIQQDLLFYYPVFDALYNCPTNEVGNKLRELAGEKDDNLEAVIFAFEKSSFGNFTDFFRDLEITQALLFGKGTKFDRFVEHTNNTEFLSFIKGVLGNDYDFVWYDDETSACETINLFGETAVERTPEEKEKTRKQREMKYQTYITTERENAYFDFVSKELWTLSSRIDADFKKCFEDYDMRDTFPHPGYKLFIEYVQSIIKSLLTPTTDITNLLYINSESAKIRRLYTLDEDNNSFVHTLSSYKDAKRDYKKNNRYVPDTFLNEWMQKFGIGHHAEIKNIEGGLGVTIRVFTDEDDLKGHLLADEGYGMTQLFNILLAIETVSLSIGTHNVFVSDKHYVSMKYVGDSVKENDYSLIALEEPENHLHPKYQSLLADMFLDAYQRFNIHFIVETHSEYMIRKSQLLVAGKNFVSNDESEIMSPFKTYYIPKNGLPYSLGYRKDGKFKEQFGSGFFDEASNLAFDLL